MFGPIVAASQDLAGDYASLKLLAGDLETRLRASLAHAAAAELELGRERQRAADLAHEAAVVADLRASLADAEARAAAAAAGGSPSSPPHASCEATLAASESRAALLEAELAGALLGIGAAKQRVAAATAAIPAPPSPAALEDSQLRGRRASGSGGTLSELLDEHDARLAGWLAAEAAARAALQAELQASRTLAKQHTEALARESARRTLAGSSAGSQFLRSGSSGSSARASHGGRDEAAHDEEEGGGDGAATPELSTPALRARAAQLDVALKVADSGSRRRRSTPDKRPSTAGASPTEGGAPLRIVVLQPAAEQGGGEEQQKAALDTCSGQSASRNGLPSLACTPPRAAQTTPRNVSASATAAFSRGTALLMGRGVQPDVALAAAAFREASDGGLPEGIAAYADALSSGVGVPRDEEAGKVLFRRAAAAGDDYAAAVCLCRGWGDSSIEAAAGRSSAQLREDGAARLAQLAAGGHALAGVALGRYLESTGGDASGGSTAAYRAAAEAGLPTAQLHLGLAHLADEASGSASAAMSWLSRAAAAGLAAAQYTLGTVSADGTAGVEANGAFTQGYGALRRSLHSAPLPH